MSAPTVSATTRRRILARRKPPTEFSSNPIKAGWITKTVLAVICVLWLVPVLGTFVTSLRPLDDVASSGWWTVFFHPSRMGNFTLHNYDQAINGNVDMGNALINSLAIALPSTFIPLLVAAIAAYAFTFMEFKGRDVLFLALISLLVVPNYVALVPISSLFASHGWNGTFAAAWLAHIGFGMSLAVFILRNYMSTLPKAIIESAKIDGATHLQTFLRLVLPMSTPALASFAIFQFLWVWNDFLVALIFIGPGKKEPVTVAVTHLKSQMGQGWELITAGGFVSMLIPIAVFLSLQRYFVRGLAAGAVKG